MEGKVNYEQLFKLIKSEGEISEKALLEKARRRGIFKPTYALRCLVNLDYVQASQKGGETFISLTP